MSWSQPGGKPLSELMMVNLLMHICVTQPQWAKIRQLQDCLIFNKGIQMLVRWHLYIKTAPDS